MSYIKLSESQRLEVSSFKTAEGDLFINVRKFYKTKTNDSWMPTKQGLSIPVGKNKKLRDAIKDEALNIEDRATELETKGKGGSKTKDKSANKKTKK